MIDEKLTNEFLNVVEKHKKLIYKVSSVYCDSTIDKEDLFQEIVANLWKAYPDFKGNSKISSWIYRIALNTVITWFRDYSKQKKYVEYGNLIPNVSDDNELYKVQYIFTNKRNIITFAKKILCLRYESR